MRHRTTVAKLLGSNRRRVFYIPAAIALTIGVWIEDGVWYAIIAVVAGVAFAVIGPVVVRRRST